MKQKTKEENKTFFAILKRKLLPFEKILTVNDFSKYFICLIVNKIIH